MISPDSLYRTEMVPITVAELTFEAQKSRCPSQNQQALEQFLLPLMILDLDKEAAQAYGKLRALLEARGSAGKTKEGGGRLLRVERGRKGGKGVL